MSTRQVITTGITLALGFILGALTWQPTFAQPKSEPTVVGRFQTARVSNSSVVIIDTTNGHCWVRYIPQANWVDQGSPS